MPRDGPFVNFNKDFTNRHTAGLQSPVILEVTDAQRRNLKISEKMLREARLGFGLVESEHALIGPKREEA